YRIEEFAILHHFIMHVRCGGGTCAAHCSYLIPSFNFLTCPHGEVIHVGISGSKSKTMVDDNIFTIAAEFCSHLFHHPIAGSIDRRAFGGREVDPCMHLSYFQNGM